MIVDELAAVWTKDMYMAGSLEDGVGHYCVVGAMRYLLPLGSETKSAVLRLMRKAEDKLGVTITEVNDKEGYDAVIALLRKAEAL